jgi:hypothetical protein
MGELIYTIDPVQSEKDGALVIKIQEAQREGFAWVPVARQRPLTLPLLNQLATDKDRLVIPFLIGEENAYVKLSTGKAPDKDRAFFSCIRINYRSSHQAFKLLAATGKVYHKEKSLAIDLFSKNEFYYLIDTDKEPSVQGWIKSTSQEFPLQSCDFICKGPPHWFIKGVSLKFLSNEVAWKDLKAVFEGAPLSAADLIEEARQDEASPKVIVKSLAQIQAPEPLPILILKDRLGSFADLHMHYPDAIPIAMQERSTHAKDSSGRSLCKRNIPAEEGWEKDLLETSYIKKPVGNSHYYCPLDKVAKSIAFLLEIGWQVQDWQGKRVVQHSRIDLVAETNDTTIFIKGKVLYDDFQADLSQVVGAFNRRERFAEIAPGCVALLPNSWDQQGLDVLTEDGEIVGDAICIRRNSIGTLSALLESQPVLLDSGLQAIKEKLQSFQGISTVEPGKDFKGVLRPYQNQGLDWLSFLADEMGLGKTVQVLAFLSRIERKKPSLIVVPTSLIFNWKKEIEKFLPRLSVVVHHGSERFQASDLLSQSDLILTTYATLRLDQVLLSRLSYECLILDEAQAIKNSHTQTFKAVSSLASRFRLSITGTPIENSQEEL